MNYKSLIKIVIICLSFSPYAVPKSEQSDRLLSAVVQRPSLVGNLPGDSPYRNVIVYLSHGYNNDETEEKESEGLFSGKYTLLYQGTGLLLIILLIRRLMGKGKKPNIKDKEI